MHLLTTEDDGLWEDHPGDRLNEGRVQGQRPFVGVVASGRFYDSFRPREQRACRDVSAGVGLPQEVDVFHQLAELGVRGSSHLNKRRKYFFIQKYFPDQNVHFNQLDQACTLPTRRRKPAALLPIILLGYTR